MQEDKLLPKVDNCDTILKVNPYSDFTFFLPCLSDLVLSLVLELATELWYQTHTAAVCLLAKKTGLYNRKWKVTWLLALRFKSLVLHNFQQPIFFFFFKKSEEVLNLSYINKVEDRNKTSKCKPYLIKFNSFATAFLVVQHYIDRSLTDFYQLTLSWQLFLYRREILLPFLS